jgi:hypothetical protein
MNGMEDSAEELARFTIRELGHWRKSGRSALVMVTWPKKLISRMRRTVASEQYSHTVV